MTHRSGVWFHVTGLEVASGQGCGVTTVHGAEHLDDAAGIGIDATGPSHPRADAAIAARDAALGATG